MPVLRWIGRRLRAWGDAKRTVLMGLVVVLVWTESLSFVVPRRPRAEAAQAPVVARPPVRDVAPGVVVAPAALTPAPVSVRVDGTRRSERIALLIGLNDAPGAQPLPGSTADVVTMRTALMGYGFRADDITTLTDAEATRGRVISALDELAARSSSAGIAVVAIATHSSDARNGHSFRVWDGRVSARALALRLGRVRGRLWTMLAMCYAGGYAQPGVIGPDRVAIFSSSAEQKSWQIGSLGSFAMLYVVRYAMIDGGAPRSVEAAFEYGRRRMAEDERRALPVMSDGVDGELVLGPLPRDEEQPDATAPPTTPQPADTPEPPPTTPAPTPAPAPDAGIVADVIESVAPALDRATAPLTR